MVVSAQVAAPVKVVLATEVSSALPQRTDLELRANRALLASERLVIELGGLDITDLFRSSGASFSYRSELMPLPAGEQELVVSIHPRHEVSKELLRETIRIRTRHGLDSFNVTPSADIEGISQIDSGHSPDDGFARPDYEEATGQFRLETVFARSAWRFTSEVSLIGVTEIENALRFGEKQEQADRLDLASYRARIETDQGFAELGHTSYGEQRHLIDGFSTRGFHASARFGSAARLSVLAGSGTQIVGFDDITGLSRSEHQILSSTLDITPLVGFPEALRVQVGFLDGSLLPKSNFNQGFINDAEESRGYSVRLTGEPSSRIRFDAAYSGSQFGNPDDPLLNQGADVVRVIEEDRNAYYADLDVVLLRSSPEEGWYQELTLSLNHEHIEPLYRSTAAFVQADYELSRATLTGVSGPISYTAGHIRSEDNLDDIPSILKTRTRGYSVNLALPFGQIWDGVAKPVLLPTLTFSNDRTRQYGVDLPDNGGFSESHVPDQVSLSQVGGLEWQGNRWRFGYELAFSDQDNRQPGRELNDFEQLNHALRFDLALLSSLDLGFEYSRERAESKQERTVYYTRRPALNVLWRTTDRLQWNGSYSMTENEGATSLGESRVGALEGAYRLSFGEARRHGMGGQIFLRYTNEHLEESDELFGFVLDRRDWTIQLGLNLSFR